MCGHRIISRLCLCWMPHISILFLTSSSFFFVLDKPICRRNQKQIYGVARHENTKILCEVESYPPPDSFSWSFNNSAETIEFPQTRYNSENYLYSSTLTYSPITELDYGTVSMDFKSYCSGWKFSCICHTGWLNVNRTKSPQTPLRLSIIDPFLRL